MAGSMSHHKPDAPTLQSPNNGATFIVSEGGTMDVDLTAVTTDPDGDDIVYRFWNADNGVVIDTVYPHVSSGTPVTVTWDNLGPGNYHWYAKADDWAGGFGEASDTFSFTIEEESGPDTIPPTVSIANLIDGSTVSDIVSVTATASDNVGVAKVEFYIDDNRKTIDTDSPYSYNWNTRDYNDGSHTVTAIAYDAADNVASDTITVIVDNIQENPPVADFSASPRSGDAPLAVSFTDSSTNNPTSWSWTFGDGSTASNKNPSHTYTSPGEYDVSLTVSNSDGSDTETKKDYITVTKADPTPDFSFIHITDLHLHASTSDMEGWLKVVENIKKINPVPSFVICTGDIADIGCSNSGYLTYRGFVDVGLSGSKGNWKLKGTSIPIYFCPGNHDAYTIAYGINGGFSNYEKVIGNLYYTKPFDIAGHSIKLFSLNGGMDNGDFGDLIPNGNGLSESQISNFERDVQASVDIKIVLVHHPYICLDGYLKGTFDNNRDRFINACNGHGVSLVFSGHTHAGVRKPMNQSGHTIWTDNNGKFTIEPNDPTAFIITDSIGGYKDEDEDATYRKIDVYANGDIIINTPTSITNINRVKSVNTPFLNFLKNHPNVFPMLRLLLQLPIFNKILSLR